MAIRCATVGDGCTRNGAFLDLTSDWTKARWVQIVTAPTTYQVIWQLGGGSPPSTETPPWVAAFTDAVAQQPYSEGDIGGGPVDAIGMPVRTGQWVYVVTRYTAATTTLETIIDGILGDPGTLDLSAVAAQASEYLGTDTASEGQIAFSFDRSWQAALSLAELAQEREATSAVRTANLLSDTPLTSSTDLSDASGHNHGWTAVGTLTTTTSPFAPVGIGPVRLFVPREVTTATPADRFGQLAYVRQYDLSGNALRDFQPSGIADLFALGVRLGRPVGIGSRIYALFTVYTGVAGATTQEWVYGWDLATGAHQVAFRAADEGAGQGAHRLGAHPEGDLVVESSLDSGATFQLRRYTVTGTLVSTSATLTDPDGTAFLEDFFYTANGATVYATVGHYLTQYDADGTYVARIAHLTDTYVTPTAYRCVPFGATGAAMALGLLQNVGPDDVPTAAVLTRATGALTYYGDPTAVTAINVGVEGAQTAIWVSTNEIDYTDLGVDGPHALTQRWERYAVTGTTPTAIDLVGRYTAASSSVTNPLDRIPNTQAGCWFTCYAPLVAPEPPDLPTHVTPIRRLRQAPHLWDGASGHRLTYPGFQLLVESGVRVANDGPLTFGLQWSDDGGHVWSNLHVIEGSQIGQYRFRFWWRRLGQSRDRVFRVVNSDDAKVVLIDALLVPDPQEGAS